MKYPLKEKLERGEVAFGTWITVNSTDLVEMASDSGFDFLIFDTEHSPLTIESVQSLLQAMKSSPTTPIVRVAWNDQVLIKLALDSGAAGLVIPLIKNSADVLSASRAMKYPPEGARGIGPRRASNYYNEVQDYVSRANQELLTVLQIEHADAVADLDSIAEASAKAGVDSLFVGPADLSASMGIFGKYEDSNFVNSLSRVLEVSKRVDIAAGIHAFNLDDAMKRAKQGFRVIAVSSDVSMISGTFRGIVKDLKKNI
jgi:2-keto-3-deoxy-L-rhamnonate aldolase RhmA